MDELDEVAPSRPPQTPDKVIAALIWMWLTAAAGAIVTLQAWATISADNSLGDALYYYPVTTAFLPLVTVLLVVAACGFQIRRNWARVTGVIVAALGCVSSLFSLGAGFENVIALVAFGLMYAMLISRDAKTWCGVPPRKRRART
jgi:Ca2+/Na+ antiporter